MRVLVEKNKCKIDILRHTLCFPLNRFCSCYLVAFVVRIYRYIVQISFVEIFQTRRGTIAALAVSQEQKWHQFALINAVFTDILARIGNLPGIGDITIPSFSLPQLLLSVKQNSSLEYHFFVTEKLKGEIG